MVEKLGRPRKAVGSNDDSKKGKSTSRGRPRRQEKQPRTSSHAEEYHSAHSKLNEDAAMRATALSGGILLESHEAQIEERALPSPDAHTTTTVKSQNSAYRDERYTLPDSPSSSSSSSAWEDLSIPSPLPSATPFPGTWPAAMHDTSAALAQVSTATISYASAIASSDIGRASWSIGTAALSSTNRAALSFTTWGMEKTGVMPNELPAPVRR